MGKFRPSGMRKVTRPIALRRKMSAEEMSVVSCDYFNHIFSFNFLQGSLSFKLSNYFQAHTYFRLYILYSIRMLFPDS